MKSLLSRRLRGTRRALSAAGALALIAGGAAIATGPTARAATGTTYYVSASGSDTNPGTSASSPWRSLAKIDATTFQPGDRILLQAGSAWTGQLWPKGSGTSGAPITIGAYGSGAKPSIAGSGKTSDAVKLWNQQYWRVTGIDVSNFAGSAAANLGDFRGIHIGGDDGRTLSGFTVDGVDVHDVTGEVRWIGGSASNDTTGITWANGWDRSKDTGGIVFNTAVAHIASPPSTPTVLNAITVQNSSILNTSFGGIVLKQYTGDAPGAVSTGWGSRTSVSDSKFAPFTNVMIQNNYITQHGTAYGCDGIYITDVRGGVVQHNLIDRVGTSGIELYSTDRITVQHNEATGTTKKAGGVDSNGIDTDIATTASVVQYNYIHGNGEGYLACACKSLGFGDAIFRYNVLAGNSAIEVHLANSSHTTTQLYNNTIYNTGAKNMVEGSGGTNLFSDNIFYTTVSGAAMSTSSGIAYSHDLYGGSSPTVPSGDAHHVIGDPRFANPTAGGTGTQAGGPDLSAGLNWRISAGSPAIGAGVGIANNGGVDYAGVTVPTVPDVGALQHS
jgi:hypothetical protein